jgi:hypothetical protein
MADALDGKLAFLRASRLLSRGQERWPEMRLDTVRIMETSSSSAQVFAGETIQREVPPWPPIVGVTGWGYGPATNTLVIWRA